MNDISLVNIRHKDGKFQRLPRNEAAKFVSSGAKYTSHTLFKADKAGVTVNNKMSDKDIKTMIRRAKKGSQPSEVDFSDGKRGSVRKERETRQSRKNK